MPTNVLCPCGTVARRLSKLGVEHDVRRVAQSRRNRPEIVELTGQQRVPVLVDGEEIIHDSRRILQHLERCYAEKADQTPSTIESDGQDDD
jgi:glutathione S-transferase